MRVQTSLEELQELALLRLKKAGLTHFPIKSPPELRVRSVDFVPKLAVDHLCHRDGANIELAPFLVVSPESVCSVDRYSRRWIGNRSHDCYWVVGAYLTHDGGSCTGDFVRAGFRDGTLREAVCLMAQQPKWGSVRVDDKRDGQSIIEACFWGHTSPVRLHRAPNIRDFWFPFLMHHRLFVPAAGVPVCSSTRDLVLSQ